jgi:hypothetical protein
MDTANAERIVALLQKEINWSSLLQMAFIHNLAPLLYRNAKALFPRDVPEAILSELKQHIQAGIEDNLYLTQELLYLVTLFDQHGIQMAPYKGPVLAASAYGDIALRPFRDLDILVHGQDVLQATDLLVSCGYQIVRPTVVAQTVRGQQSRQIEELISKSSWAYQLVLSHPERQVFVELHWRLTPKHIFAVNAEQIWEHLQPVTFAGVTVSSLAAEQLLWFLCVHGAKHHWAQLNWICDVAELIRASPSLDWEGIIVQVKELGCERRFYLGLLLAHCLLQAPLPKAIETRVYAIPQVGVLAQQVIQWVSNGGGTAIFLGLDSLVFSLKSMDYITDRARHLRYLMTPATADRAMMKLPLGA